MKKLAIFDIDGTIFRSSLIIELLNELTNQNIFPKKALTEIEKDYEAWINRRGSYEIYITKVVEVYKKYIKGCSVKDFEKAENIVIKFHKDKVYRYTRDLISTLKKEKYFLIAISGSPSGIVSKFSSTFGFDYFLGSTYEVKKNSYTGKILHDPFLEGKDKAILEYINKNNMKCDLKNSIAIGDSHGDISLLELVGNPIAFNPSSILAKVAKEKGWRIIVERKDVIYDIESFQIISEKKIR